MDESVTIKEQNIKMSGEYDKRNKLYSRRKWIDTSPIIINPSFEIVTTNIIVYKKKLKCLIKYTYKDLDCYTIDCDPSYPIPSEGRTDGQDATPSYNTKINFMCKGIDLKKIIYRQFM